MLKSSKKTTSDETRSDRPFITHRATTSFRSHVPKMHLNANNVTIQRSSGDTTKSLFMQCKTGHLLVQRPRLHLRIEYTYGKSKALLSHVAWYKSPAQKLCPKCTQKDWRVWELSSRRREKTQTQRHSPKLRPWRGFVGSGKLNARTDLNRSCRECSPSVDQGHVPLRKMTTKYSCFSKYTVMVLWFLYAK